MKVLVTGGTGNLGSTISRELAKQGLNVKVASHSGRTVDNLDSVAFDYTNNETYASALEDVSSVVLMAIPMDPFSDEKLIPFIDAAKNAGVKSVVMISAFGVNHNPEAGLTKIEKHIESSRLNYVIVRPNFFMDNFTTGFVAPTIASDNAMYLAAGEGKTSFIATSDIAKFVAETLKNIDKYKGNAYDITGTEALAHNEVAKIISDVKGEEVRYVSISAEDMKAGAMQNGMPEPFADMMLGLYSATEGGFLSAITTTFEQVLGQKPLVLKDFLSK